MGCQRGNIRFSLGTLPLFGRQLSKINETVHGIWPELAFPEAPAQIFGLSHTAPTRAHCDNAKPGSAP